LKVLDVAEERTAGGRLFHALGRSTANARSPIVERRVAGTTRSVDDDDRKRRQAVPPTGVASSVKYRGAVPWGGVHGEKCRTEDTTLRNTT